MSRFGIAVALFSISVGVLSHAQRDPQAIVIANTAYTALGGSLPTDSRANGTYDRIIGSSEDAGSIEILTRGNNQTSEKLSNSSGTNQLVYSRGYASQWDNNGVTHLSLEKSLASNSVTLPMLIIATAILDLNSTVQFVGMETVNGQSTNHIRICSSSPDQNFTDISSLGTKDVWIAVSSNLPIEIAYQVLDAEGTAPIPVSAFYSNYQSINGVLYPLQVQELRNGTPYLAITITNVAFGVGLTDQNFPLQ